MEGPSVNSSLGGRRLIFSRWEFWVGVLVLVAGTFFLKNYFEWVGSQAVVRMQGMLAQEEWQRMQLESGALEAAYRADTYGGETPEETLRLFVEALEKEDTQLASKYYVVENQERKLESLGRTKGLKAYIDVLKSKNNISIFDNETKADVEFYDKNGNQIHFERMVLNPFTKKWKILEP